MTKQPSKTDRIENLKKVGLSTEAGTSPERMDLTPNPLDWEFIFGIGQEGLTPFEYELAGKGEGDEVIVRLEKGRVDALFGHLCRNLPPLGASSGTLFIKSRVTRVAPAESREVVRAMAESAACGEGCCGDGACGH